MKKPTKKFNANQDATNTFDITFDDNLFKISGFLRPIVTETSYRKKTITFGGKNFIFVAMSFIAAQLIVITFTVKQELFQLLNLNANHYVKVSHRE